MAGTYAFINSCRKAGIKPIAGQEAYYTLGDRHLREKDAYEKAYYHMILLAKNDVGLKNLFKIASAASTEGLYFKPRCDDDLLATYNEGLIATTACLGSAVSQHIMRGAVKAAEVLIDHHAAIFKDRFFLELQTHNSPEQKVVNDCLLSISKRKNLPIVVTADAHYTRSCDKDLHELTLRMNTEGQGDAFSFGDIECHLHHHDEMWCKCQAVGIPYEAISNTVHIANQVDADSYFSEKKSLLPKFKSLPEGLTPWQYLEALARKGLYEKIGNPLPDIYEQRLMSEMSVLKKASACDYLLIVWEYMKKARDLDILTGFGRGSGAGSLVCYAVDITQVDPIKHGLIMERFLNIGRLGVPILF